jgi:hypothetical protein
MIAIGAFLDSGTDKVNIADSDADVEDPVK